MSERHADEVSYDYDALVSQMAHMVDSGVGTLDDVSVPRKVREAGEADTFDLDGFREDVRECIEAGDEGDETVSSDEQDGRVDWASLFEEFGFDTPNATGEAFATPLQLEGALDVTVGGNPGAHIQRGLDAGAIDKLLTDDGQDRGYRLGGGA